MRKRAVRLRHLVCVFAFLDRIALTGGRVFDFLREGVGHSHSFTIVRVLNDPAGRDFTSSRGRTFSTALFTTSSGSTESEPSRDLSIAVYTIRSASDLLPRFITVVMRRATAALP